MQSEKEVIAGAIATAANTPDYRLLIVTRTQKYADSLIRGIANGGDLFRDIYNISVSVYGSKLSTRDFWSETSLHMLYFKDRTDGRKSFVCIVSENKAESALKMDYMFPRPDRVIVCGDCGDKTKSRFSHMPEFDAGCELTKWIASVEANTDRKGDLS